MFPEQMNVEIMSPTQQMNNNNIKCERELFYR